MLQLFQVRRSMISLRGDVWRIVSARTRAPSTLVLPAGGGLEGRSPSKMFQLPAWCGGIAAAPRWQEEISGRQSLPEPLRHASAKHGKSTDPGGQIYPPGTIGRRL